MNGIEKTLVWGLCSIALATGGRAQQLGAGTPQPAMSTAFPVVTVSGTTPSISSCCGAIITTLIGNGIAGYAGDGGPASATTAEVSAGLRNIAVDTAGDVFFSDVTAQTVRVIYEGGATAASLIQAENVGTTPTVGDVYALVGAEGITGGGPTNGELGSTARLTMTTGALSLDAAGDVYFYDSATNKIWVLYAGGTNTAATNFISLEAGVTSPVLGSVYAIAGSNAAKGYAGAAAYNNVLATSSAVEFYYIDDMKFDATGNMYVVDNGNACVWKVSASTGNISPFAGTPGTAGNGLPVTNDVYTPKLATAAALSSPYGVAVSPSGDVYIADENNNEVKVVYEGGATTAALIALENANSAVLTGSPTVGTMYMIAGSESLKAAGFGYLATRTSIPKPTMVALDNAGNVYIAATYIQEVNVNTGYLATIVGNSTSGYAGDGGLATSGETQAVRGMAVDASGRIYIADAPNERIREVSGGLMVFTGQTVGTTSAPELLLLTNTGNATLNFTGAPTTGGTNASDYAVDTSYPTPTSTVTYEPEFLATQTPTVCTFPSSLAAGASCLLPLTYTPIAPGITTATLSIPTNDALSPQTINLQGQLTPTSTALTPSAITSYPGGIVTLTATVSAAGGTPTGTIKIYAGSSTGTLLETFTIPVSGSDTVSLILPTLTVGAYTYTAVYSGDNAFAASTAALTLNADSFTVSASPATLTVAPGGEAATTLTIIGTGPSAQTLSLSCSEPAILGCAFFTSGSQYATPTVTFAAGATTAITLQVSAVPTTSMRSVATPSKMALAVLLPFGAMLAFGLGARRRSSVSLMALLLCLGSLGMLSGCVNSEKSNVGTPLGPSTQTVTVNVSGTGSSTSYTQSVTLTVNVQ